MTIRPMRATDAEAVLRTYQTGLDSGHASFEATAPSWEAFDTGKLPEHRHVADDGGTVLGGSRCRRCPAATCTPEWSNTPSTSTRPHRGTVLAGYSSTP